MLFRSERHELTAAGALEELRGTLSMVLGPAAAGLLIAAIGLPSTYGIDIATFVVSLAALRLMRAVPPPADADRPSVAADRGCPRNPAHPS